jgi:flavodoxin
MEPLEDTLGALNVEITVKNRERLDEVARGELSWLITKPTWARTDFVGKESRSFPQDVT